MKKSVCIWLAAALLLCGCGSAPRKSADVSFSEGRRAASASAWGIFGKDPLAFVDAPCQIGNAEDSAPYVVLNKFLKVDKPYLAFTSDWRCDRDAENTYYNVHSWYDADDDAYNSIKPGSGYTGFQNVNGGHLAILSMWAVPGCEPVVEYAKKGSRIEPFSGEGVGTKVLIPYNWKVGKWYTNCIQTRNEGDTTYYDLFVRPEGGKWELLATISIALPELGMNWDCSFLEDFTYNGLERADSFRNITATLADGTSAVPETISLNAYNNNTFEIANEARNCSFSAKDGVISLRACKETIVDTCMFPAQLDTY